MTEISHSAQDAPTNLAPTLASIAAMVEALPKPQPDDVRRLYMSAKTFSDAAERVGGAGNLPGFGIPVHVDDSMPYGTIDREDRDGSRYRITKGDHRA